MPKRERSRKDPREPISIWTEKDFLDGEEVKALVAILATRGCSWSRESGCSMCGYTNDCPDDVTHDALMCQVGTVLERLPGHDTIKVFTSGSFLDQDEVPRDVQLELAKGAGRVARRLTFETRPGYVDEDWVRELSGHARLEVALGLESSNDTVLARSVNKGFAVGDYVDATEVLKGLGVDVKTYLLLKPPYLTEGEAIQDAMSSVEFASGYSGSISVNPVNVQRGTLVERMWRSGQYRPPWLWSLVEVLRGETRGGTWLVSQPTGGGRERGAHNCGRCDDAVLDAVSRFNATQDPSVFDDLDCQCRERWLDVLEIEGLYQNSVRLD